MIRKAAVTDIEGILEVLSRYHFKVLRTEDEAVIDESSDEIIKIYNTVSELDLRNGFVAEMDGKIVGFSHYKPFKDDAAKTTLLSVLPDYRRHGFGRELQLQRMKEARKRGFSKMITFCDNNNAVDWYIKYFGYRIRGTDENHHRLHFIRINNKTIWGIHYGFPNSEGVTVLECDLEEFFGDK